METKPLESAQRVKLDRLKKLEQIFGPTSWIVAIASAAATWWMSSSIWLAVFVFLMVARFVAGCVPKIIFHDRRIYRTTFYLLWPVGGALILWGTYNLSGVMWLSTILGLVGGTLVSVFVGVLFFRDVATEDQSREGTVVEHKLETRLEKDPAAAAMKERFTTAEWDELKRLPMLSFQRVAMAGGGVSKKAIEAWTEIAHGLESIDDPLLRMLVFDLDAAWARMGGNDPVRMTNMMMSSKRLEQATDAARESVEALFASLFDLSEGGTGGPHALELLEQELSPEELRSFGRALSAMGLKIAIADGAPTKEQMEEILSLVPPANKEDLLSRLGIEADSH